MRRSIGFFALLFFSGTLGCTSEHQFVHSLSVTPIPTSLVTVTPFESEEPADSRHHCKMDLTDELLQNDISVLATVWNRLISQSPYPEIARANRWQGRVLLCVDVSQSGTIEDVSLYVSSGNTVLDQEALNTARSVRAVKLQHPLSQSHVLMEVPINYTLEKIGFFQQLLADALWRHVSAKSVYPSYAVQSKLQGKVVLRVTLKPDGRVGLIEVQESSGVPLLDQAAIHSVHQATPFPFVLRYTPLPAIFILPFLYTLDPLP